MIPLLKNLVRISLSILCLAAHANSADFQVDMYVRSGDFNAEIAPANPNRIRSESSQITYIDNNSWVAFQNFDFGAGATYFWIEGASPNAGGTIELRTGSESGPLFGSVRVTNTGGFEAYQQFGTALTPSITGVSNLYLKFVGGGGYLFNTRSFQFQSIAPGLKQFGSSFSAGNFDAESAPGGAPIIANEGRIESIANGSWVAYTGFNFGAEANLFSIEGATPGKGGHGRSQNRCRAGAAGRKRGHPAHGRLGALSDVLERPLPVGEWHTRPLSSICRFRRCRRQPLQRQELYATVIAGRRFPPRCHRT